MFQCQETSSALKTIVPPPIGIVTITYNFQYNIQPYTLNVEWNLISLTLQCKQLLNLLKHIVEDSKAAELVLEHGMEKVL